MKPAIAIHHVTKTYNEGGSSVPALRGVDLKVCSGEIVMLIGPSGSGKTTLLSIMGCILRASSGNVQIAGQEVAYLDESDLPRIRRNHIGFVFQGFNLFPTLARERMSSSCSMSRVFVALSLESALTKRW